MVGHDRHRIIAVALIVAEIASGKIAAARKADVFAASGNRTAPRPIRI